MGERPRTLEYLERMQTDRIDPAFWKGRRVFVTGHTGFMGGWLSLWLCRLGADVAGYALKPPARPNLFESTRLGARMRSTIADIRDLDRLTAEMSAFAPDTVMHLAAQPLVHEACREPVDTFAVNVMGTVNLLQAIRATASVTTALIVTTDKVYENREWSWGYRECDTLGGHEPYGASKACAELAVEAFRRSYLSGARTVGIATIRAGNIIGGGDWSANRLIPDAIRVFSAGQALSLRNPAATRPWQHVLDPLRGYLMLGRRLADDAAGWSGPWNFGPAEEDTAPVAGVADELARLWGDGARCCSTAPDAHAARFPESQQLAISSSQARARLGWQPVWRLQRALAETVDWYKAYFAERDMDRFSLEQIALFEGAN